MLCGKRAFAGDTSVEIMTAILKSEPPDLDLQQTKVPPALDRIVRHCLEKDPADRFQSVRDLTFALGALSGSESSTALRAPAVQQRHWSRWAVVEAALRAGASGDGAVFSPSASPPRRSHGVRHPGSR